MDDVRFIITTKKDLTMNFPTIFPKVVLSIILSTAGSWAQAIAITDVSFNVSEHGTLSLFCLGALLLGVTRRRVAN